MPTVVVGSAAARASTATVGATTDRRGGPDSAPVHRKRPGRGEVTARPAGVANSARIAASGIAVMVKRRKPKVPPLRKVAVWNSRTAPKTASASRSCSG